MLLEMPLHRLRVPAIAEEVQPAVVRSPEEPLNPVTSAQEEVSPPLGSPDLVPWKASHLAAAEPVPAAYSATAPWVRSYPSAVSASLRCRRSTPVALPGSSPQPFLQQSAQPA